MRLPVAAKIALHRAGGIGATPGSPTPPRGLREISGHDVNADFARRAGQARDLVGVEIILLRTAVLEADFTLRGDAHAHDASALHLRPHAIRVDARTAVHRDVYTRYGQPTLVVDRDLHDCRDVADEAVVGGNPEPAPLG